MIFGIAVSLIPLIFVAASLVNTGPTFWEAFSNEELLVVAFPVGAVAAFEALIATRTRPFSAIKYVRNVWRFSRPHRFFTSNDPAIGADGRNGVNSSRISITG
jgi:hypothetical protein